jgi:two-component system, sensor histidine kinase and response regulator
MVAELIHVLLVEDDPADARLIRELLRETPDAVFETEWVDRLASALDRLAHTDRPIEAVLLDLFLPDSQGLGTCQAVLRHAPGLPIIILSAPEDEALAVQAVREGAQDYLARDEIDSSLLARAIRHAIERKRADLALRASEALYQSLVDVLPQSICRKDLAGHFTFANRNFLKAIDKPLAELVGQTDFYLHPPHLAEQYRRDDQRVMASGQIFETVEPHQHLGGDPGYVQAVKVPIRDVNGQITGVQIIFWDVTERQQVEEARARHAQIMSALYDTSLEINSQPDMSTLLPAIVQRATQLLGASMGGLYLVQPDDQALELAVSQYGDQEFEGRLLRWGASLSGRAAATGQPAMVEDYRQWPGRVDILADSAIHRALAVPLKLGRRVIGVLNVADDRYVGSFSEDQIKLVSLFADQAAIAIENARLHDQVKRHAGELERRVEERTRELTEANQRLTELDRLKDEFIARISHELRTPLANIKIYGALLKTAKPETTPKYLQTLQRETARLQQLIEDLLDVSMLNFDREPLNLSPVDLNQLAADLVTDRSALARERGLTLTCAPDPALPLFQSDVKLVAQVLFHLLANAFNYTPRDGHVTVSTACRADEAGEWITIAVTDTGPGVMPEERQHIFDRFYRGTAARNYKTAGTGLGLAFSQEIMERLNGRITVDSRPGQGATFICWLPATNT